MFCKNCGKEIDDKAEICVHCGVKTNFKTNNGCLPILAWIFCIFCALLGFSYLDYGQVFVFILYTLIAILLCPPLSKQIEEKIQTPDFGMLKIVVVIILFVLIGIFHQPITKEQSEQTDRELQQSLQDLDKANKELKQSWQDLQESWKK